MKRLKKRIKGGETLLGCWLNLGSPLTAEIVGLSGFDWVLVDFEHGSGFESDVLHMLQALEHTTASPIVRVESFERQRIHRMLDFGAEGIMCPRINDFEEALKFAKGLQYPPEGTRGVARMVRATSFNKHFDDYFSEIKENIIAVVQIETAGILNYLDEIASIDNIDVLFIGPADLSMALGIFGQFDNPLFQDAVKATVNAAEKAGKAAGILLSDPDDFTKYRDIGIKFIACGADATFVVNGAQNNFNKLDSWRAIYKN